MDRLVSWRRLVQTTVVLVAMLWSLPLSAAVERFAVLVGNNKGDAGEVELRHAESDAQKLYDTLKDLGGIK